MIKYILTIGVVIFSMGIVNSQKPIKVVASASIFQDMAKNIGGSKVYLESKKFSQIQEDQNRCALYCSHWRRSTSIRTETF